jgi:hypothetical protein
LQSFSKYYIRDEKIQRFSSDKIYIKTNGYLLKTEMLFGQFEPQAIEYKEIVSYNYKPMDLKIQTPKIK